MQKSYRTLRTLVVALPLLTPLAVPQSAFALTGGAKLPAPSVSKALDAILLPIDATVAKEFKLGKGTKGVLVLSVQPGGVAAKQGIKAGDVLTDIGGRKVSKPIDVDVAVRRGLKKGSDKFTFDLSRAGAVIAVAAVITLELYDAPFNVTEISSWESWSESTSFSYSEFVSEYSETIETSYESEETIVEEEMTHEETTSEETTSEESSTDATTSEAPAALGEAAPDEAGTADDNAADDAGTDADGDEPADTGDDAGADDAAGDDGADAGADDAGADDAGGDDGADAGGDDGGDDSGGGDEAE